MLCQVFILDFTYFDIICKNLNEEKIIWMQ